jgi:hypothetical protein
MNFGAILDDSFAYTKQGVFKNANRWLKLILAILCLGIPINGYVMRIYRGDHPAPEVDNWGTLFVDGLKLMIVGLIYTIPFSSSGQLRTAVYSLRHCQVVMVI